MSKVFLIFFPLFFFFSLLETPIAFRVRVLAAKPPRPPHPPTDRPRLLRGAVSPPHQNPPIWGNSSLPLSPGAPGFARDALRGGWRASAGRENRGIGAAPHPAPPSHFFSNFVFFFFFFPSPRVFFDLPLPPAVLVARDLRCQPRCGSRAGRERGRELSASAGGCGGGLARPTEGIYFPTFPLSPNGIVVPRRNTLLNG